MALLNSFSYPGYDPTALFAGTGPYRHRAMTFASGVGVLRRGTLVGRVSATDKYIPSVESAADGSQNAANLAIVAADIDISQGDAVGPAYESGPYAFEQMIVDPSWTFATLDAALRVANSEIYVKQLGSQG